jgi:prepilin-type N-terminal cleavage/methylation domain-containing protein
MRKALTLIEVIFVIVVLGIVASIGSEIIANVYRGYIVQRAQYRASIKTELALYQIANRLRYAIPGTVMADNGGTLRPITEINVNTSNRLQWVGYDGDSFEAISSASDRKPGWSGLIDLDNGLSATSLTTPGSNLDLADEIISNLGGDLGASEIYFPDGTHYGVTGGSGTTLSVSMHSGDRVYERYKLAWSSYALVVEGGDLYLYYNFSPVPGADLGNNKSLILKNVDIFRFKGSEGALRVKLCKREPVTAESNITVCKEKVIF